MLESFQSTLSWIIAFCRCFLLAKARSGFEPLNRSRAEILLGGSSFRAWALVPVAAVAFAGTPDAEAAQEAAEEPSLSALAGVPVYCADGELENVTGIPGAQVFGYFDPGAAIMRDSVVVGHTERRIMLAASICRPLRFSGYSRVRSTMQRRAFAWHIFAHEVAHVRGYDHGEQTVGADCAAERELMRPLLRAYGVRSMYAKRLWRLERGYCA